MGPKNVAATRAHVPSKDLSWIDRMYMKFETICVEVDKNPSLLLQETSKYVESQVNAMGTNVKKLCTELIQDLLSPEGGEKKLECALHCKCHCMDSEKPKLVDIGATGKKEDSHDFEGGDDSFGGTGFQKQDISKKEVNKVETESPKNVEVCDPEINNNHGQYGTINREMPNISIGHFEIEETGSCKMLEEKLGLAKDLLKSEAQQEDNPRKFEATCRNTEKYGKKGENKVSMRGMEAAAHRREADYAEQATRPKANDVKELNGLNGPIVIGRNGDTEDFLGSQEESRFLESLPEIQVRDTEGLLLRQSSDIDLQDAFDRAIEWPLNIDASYAKLKYDSTASVKDLEEGEVKVMNRVGDSFLSVTHDFSELPRSTKEEDLIIVSEFSSKEVNEDEEQSAHWFVHEDLRKALQPEIFDVEKFQQGESFRNELDLDWELL